MNLEKIYQEAENVYRDRGWGEPRDFAIRNIVGPNGEYLEPTLPLVMAIATSGGKTWTTAARFEFLYKHGYLTKNDHVLILAADRSILRSNFVEQFEKFFSTIPASFSWRAVKSKSELEDAVNDGVQVIITIPQSINSKGKLQLLSQLNFKWLVQDEAHKWYGKKVVEKIIKTIKPKYQSLLTGTPFNFNLNADKYLIDYTPVRTIYEMGLLSEVSASVLHSSVRLTNTDYTKVLKNLKKTKRIGDDQMIKDFGDVVEQMIKKLKVPFPSLQSTNNMTKDMTSLFGKLQKTIVFTHGISEAECLYKYLQIMGIGVAISHSKRTQESEDVFSEFKKDDSVKVLVAVNQGKEGFDFPDLYNVIDMTYTQNFAVVMQIFGRVLRKSENISEKYFFKVAPKGYSDYFNDWMDAMFMLFDIEWYSTYNGKNGLDIPIPNKMRKLKKKSNSGGGSSKKNKSFKNISYMLSLKFMKDNKWFKFDSKLSTVSSTTLREINKKLKNKDSKSTTIAQLENYQYLWEIVKHNPSLFNYLRRHEAMLGLDVFQRFEDYVEVPNKQKDIKDWMMNKWGGTPSQEHVMVVMTKMSHIG